MERDHLDLPSLLQAPLQVQVRRVGERTVLELAPEGQTLIASAIELVASVHASRVHHAWASHLAGEWANLFENLWNLEPEPTAHLSRSARLLALVRSDIEAFTQEQEAAFEQLRSRHLARVCEAVASTQTMTAEELDADRALCTMLGIDPEKLPTDRLNELRELWA